jgi:hypothetical protein
LLASCGTGCCSGCRAGRCAGLAGSCGDWLELTIYEAADGAGAVLLDTLEQTGAGRMRLVVRKWLLHKIRCHAGLACGGVDRLETCGERLRGAGAAKLQHMIACQEAFDGTTEAGPKLNLSGDGTLNDVASKAGVEDEGVGELDGLAHRVMVA